MSQQQKMAVITSVFVSLGRELKVRAVAF